jgi:hypothetical protein
VRRRPSNPEICDPGDGYDLVIANPPNGQEEQHHHIQWKRDGRKGDHLLHPRGLLSKRVEAERFRAFSHDELMKRDKVSLDIFWLNDESVEDSENLPAPEVLAAEIAENPGDCAGAAQVDLFGAGKGGDRKLGLCIAPRILPHHRK